MVKVKERLVDVEDLLNRLDPTQKEITQNLRGLIRSVVPETVEIVKGGNITYKIGNEDFVWIKNYQSHVDLEFLMGSSLDSDLLRSRGTEKSEGTRHVTINDFDKTKPELARLLKEAAFLGFKHCSAPA